MTRHSELAGGQNKVAALKSVEIVHVLLCPCPGFLAPSDDVGRRTITLLEGWFLSPRQRRYQGLKTSI
jgi:hypothetical protein